MCDINLLQQNVLLLWKKYIYKTDLEPPKIANCPGDIHKMSEEKWTQVFLPGVTVTDNVGVHLFATSRQNGSEFTWGENDVTYTASDTARNNAYCHFQVIIVGRYSRYCGYVKRFGTRRHRKTILTSVNFVTRQIQQEGWSWRRLLHLFSNRFIVCNQWSTN